MRSRPNRLPQAAPENGAAELNRRLEREYRIQSERRRAIALTLSLAGAGVLLLSTVGVALAVRGGGASGTAKTPAPAAIVASAPVPTPAPKVAGFSADKTAPPPTVAVVPEAVTVPVAKATPVAKPAAKAAAKAAAPAAAAQHYTIKIGGAGYEPSMIRASSATPISLTVGKGDGCAAGFTMPSLGIEKDNSNGPVTFSLGRLKPGTYRYACAMDMVEGTVVVR